MSCPVPLATENDNGDKSSTLQVTQLMTPAELAGAYKKVADTALYSLFFILYFPFMYNGAGVLNHPRDSSARARSRSISLVRFLRDVFTTHS